MAEPKVLTRGMCRTGALRVLVTAGWPRPRRADRQVQAEPGRLRGPARSSASASVRDDHRLAGRQMKVRSSEFPLRIHELVTRPGQPGPGG
jgi:hypothetical protein